MHYYKVRIQYEGTNYAGLQWQNGLRTIQSEFNTAISKLIDGKITTMPASRTDTGVHAIEQVIKVSSINPIDTTSFLKPFNDLLPSEIRCLSIQTCLGSFKPSVESTSKEYRYLFTNKTQTSKGDLQFVANIANKLNFEAMFTCVSALEGEHDFCNFYSSGSNVKTTIRNIIKCELTEIDPRELLGDQELFQLPGDLTLCYQLKIEANGFLKQMIRHLVSAIWMVGSGKISSEEFISLLNSPKDNKQRWKVATPNGLYLYRINYPES